jgi:hypothetical protein
MIRHHLPLFILLMVLTFVSGTLLAQQQELSIKQQILMPGPLVAGHAEYETKCESCHTSFEKTEMTNLCLNCHKDIANDRISYSRFHGQDRLASTNDCETCHKDHKGRDADVAGLLPDSFDHSATRFVLSGTHASLTCNNCHQADIPYRETKSDCVDCHLEKDIHGGAVGEQCETCHQTDKWSSLLAFDHEATNFQLHGMHTDLSCNSCHIAQQYTFTDTSCVSCHKISDVHAGVNGDKCEDCHTEQNWDKFTFDHAKTSFPLEDSHADIPCQACHTSNDIYEEIPATCNNCHASDDIHLGRNGEQCEICHGITSWSQVEFNHERDTDYPLTGLHADLGCSQCHTGSINEQLPRSCAGCHIADDVHRTETMQVCDQCHNTQDWTTTIRFDHDFSNFPLLGMHQITSCESCHINNQYTAIDQQCESCHTAEDQHRGALGPDCGQCHNPNAWNIWSFDHTTQTDYPLDGKHEDLACDSCHPPGSNVDSTPSDCVSCHKSQDIHNGEFGSQCDRCHNTSNFFEISIQ